MRILLRRKNEFLLMTATLLLLFPISANAEMVEQDFVAIDTMINSYESAYSRKDIAGMSEHCDRTTEWFKGLEVNMRKEFDRYKYIRTSSVRIKLTRDPRAKNEDDLICVRRALYIGYIDADAPRVSDQQNTSASLNEYNAVYYVGCSADGGEWKIRAFGQMPGDDQIAYLKGKGYSVHGKIQDAFSEYNKSITINPEYSPAYSGLSDLSFALGKISDSIKYAEKAVDLRPSFAYYHYSLGMVYAFDKNKEKAIQQFDETKKIDKEFPDIDYFITNIDKLSSAADDILRRTTINDKIAKVLDVKIEKTEGGISIAGYNLYVNKPIKWHYTPRVNWHTLVAISAEENPSLTDPMARIEVRPAAKKITSDLNLDIAKEIAILFHNTAVVRLGKEEKVDVAGGKADEDFFAYTVDNGPVIAIVTTFLRDGIAYSLIYSDKAKDMRIDTRPYKEILSGISYLDPSRKISPDIIENLVAAEESSK